LRWYDAQGNWIPTNAERADREKEERQKAEQRAKVAEQKAEQERQRAERLAQLLRAQGIDPDNI
jgi:hypothetical protein